MKKNYIEHDIRVRYIDGILSQSKDWQWLVDYIEANYDFDDVDSWSMFIKRHKNLRSLYECFVKILSNDIDKTNLSFQILREIYIVAMYFNGKVDSDEAIAECKSNYAKILLLTIWITKLQNQGSSTSIILDMRIFMYRNFFKLVNVEYLQLYEDEIVRFMETIELHGFEIPKKCVLDNINKIQYTSNLEFIKEHREQILRADAFNYSRIKLSQDVSWEEKYLIDMLNIKIESKGIQPLSIFNGVSYPDISLWKLEIIEHIKQYFNDEVANFVLETISYILYKTDMSDKTILLHMELMLKRLEYIESDSIRIQCSSFEILSYVFKEGIKRKLRGEHTYREMLSAFHRIEEPKNINLLQTYNIPLSREQRTAVKKYYEEQYKLIDEVSNQYELLEYCQNINALKSNTSEYFIKAITKFDAILKNDCDILPSLFYWYMIFLIRLKNQGMNVEKRLINYEMIRVQKLWEEKYYKKCIDGLNTFEKNIEISSVDIELFNSNVLRNIFIVSQNCMLPDIDSMIRVMETVSKYAISYLVTNIHVDEFYPVQESSRLNYDRHVIDSTLSSIVNNIIKEHGYKFLNVLNTDVYVKAIHKQYINAVKYQSSFFNAEEKLYEMLQDKLREYQLIPYTKELSLGFITQLFPILEIKLRDLAVMVNIVPFKESEKAFMQYKDPSSILREVLLLVYNELGTYENVGDLLFVYNFMYNSYSLNIRNELIHGRKYIDRNGLRFAFKITLFSLEMILKRIQIIEANMKRIEEVEEA